MQAAARIHPLDEPIAMADKARTGAPAAGATAGAGERGPGELPGLGAGVGVDEALRGPEVAGLVAQAQGGDPAAFERLIALYQTKVYGFARAFTSDPEQASDLAQDALIKIYRSLGGFRFQSSLTTWIFRIVKNVFLDHYKSRRQKERRLEQPLDLTSERETTDGEERGPEAQLLRHEERRALWDALHEVPEIYRTVLVLADMQGLSYEEVAAVVEAPVGTVKSRLNRGREALRELLYAKRRKKAYTSGERP